MLMHMLGQKYAKKLPSSFKNLYGLSNQLVCCTLAIITIAMVGTFPLLNAFFVWEIMYRIKANMCTMSGKWVVNLLWNLDFINAKVEKHLSSSTLPTTFTITNLANLTYLGKSVTKMQDVVTKHHILIKGFISKGGAKQFVAFDFIVNLNMPYWHSRLFTYRNS
jgi:hypothetical protein